MIYHNDNEKSCVRWLHHLMNEKFIPEGIIDGRSITEIKPDEIKNFTQCHFFAGIGGWSEALRLAGWDSDKPIWTASCPCQPFSVAGARRSERDERHLWPVLFDLIRECLPSVIVGEQVASNLGRDWLSAVFADLETLGYRVAGADLCSASIGAVHIRQRLYWVAYAQCRPAERHGLQVAGTESEITGKIRQGTQRIRNDSGDGSNLDGMADLESNKQRERPDTDELQSWNSAGDSKASRVENTKKGKRGVRPCKTIKEKQEQIGGSGLCIWKNIEWIRCADKKSRPIEPGILPVAYGVSGRVDAIKGYGNSIDPYLAGKFLKVVKDITND